MRCLRMAHERNPPTPDEIAVCAYYIWEAECRPLDREKENWIQAETVLLLLHERIKATPFIRQGSLSDRNSKRAGIQMASTMARSGKGSRRREPRILVVDDEPLATHMLGGLLRRYGYTVAELNDATKALEMAHRFQPDILLLDIHMPWKDGHEVAAEFASNKFQCGVPIVFITHDPLDRDKRTDSIPILLKPFSIEDLFARLREGIAKSV